MRKMIPLAALAMLAMMVSVARAEDKQLKPGDVAPAFSLQDQNGKTVSLADLKGKTVVLEWFNEDCPIWRRTYEQDIIPKTFSKHKDEVVWLAINSTQKKTNESNKAAAAKFKIDRPILNDADGTVGHAYAAKNTPQMFIIDKEGKIAYNGGIDNDPQGEKTEKINYVSKALAEMAAGKPVSEPMTTPYGCSVKYAK